MDDRRLWEFERELWVGPREVYREKVDAAVVMALPSDPHLLHGEDAIRAVESTPSWDEAEFSEQAVSRPQEGLIVIGYRMRASKAGHDDYMAFCTSTIRRVEHEVWRVVQHSQLPPPVVGAGVAEA